MSPYIEKLCIFLQILGEVCWHKSIYFTWIYFIRTGMIYSTREKRLRKIDKSIGFPFSLHVIEMGTLQ